MSTEELINYRYGDRGGWEGVMRISKSEVPYEQKLADICSRYRVKRDTAIRWYRYARAVEKK